LGEENRFKLKQQVSELAIEAPAVPAEKAVVENEL
jgi:hypothetical protein